MSERMTVNEIVSVSKDLDNADYETIAFALGSLSFYIKEQKKNNKTIVTRLSNLVDALETAILNRSKTKPFVSQQFELGGFDHELNLIEISSLDLLNKERMKELCLENYKSYGHRFLTISLRNEPVINSYYDNSLPKDIKDLTQIKVGQELKLSVKKRKK